MTDKDADFVHAGGSLSEPKEKREPLFIEEDDEEDFEDCLEEIEAALTFPSDSMTYTAQIQECLQAEFNGLMRQMLAQLDDFDATHETKSTPSTCFPESEDVSIRHDFKDTGEYEGCFAKPNASIAVDETVGSTVEARPELSTTMEIEELGRALEDCIKEVGCLESKREELVQELLELEKPMLEEVEALRAEVGSAQNLLSKARLERQGLQEEVRVLKRRLFAAARDCAQNQMALLIQQKEVEQFHQAQEEMQAYIGTLTEEIAQLNTEHQSRLKVLQNQKDSITQESSKDITRSYLSQGRRASINLQQYLQEGIKSLEEWYEPRLVALLKRREASADALSKSRELCQELKAQVGPLIDEEKKLALQRTRLEERMHLMEKQRKENVDQYRETIDLLEESSRELKTELQIQINKIKEMETLTNGLAKQLYFYRESTEAQQQQEIILMEEKT
ncbi:syncoilin [Brachyhypopomus gauderio]|uniref:syncoilin n=1 Tax=Brachyhypopomus gauderio TaxID=698409 RepID=UPI0040428690